MKTIPHTTDERYNKTLKHFEVSHNFFNAPLYNKDIEELIANLREEIIKKNETIKVLSINGIHLSKQKDQLTQVLKRKSTSLRSIEHIIRNA